MKIKKIFLFIGLFLLFLFNDLFYLIPLSILKIDYNSLSYNTESILSLVGSICTALIIFIIYRKYLKSKIIDYKANFKKYMDIGFKYWMIGLVSMFVSNILISLFSPVHEANNEALVQEMLKQAPFITFISAALVAPFLEEMLFRKSFGDIFKNKKIMVIASGILFGLLHVVFSMETSWDLLYVIPYGMLGYGFACSLEKTDNVYVPMTFHIIHNTILTLASIIMTFLTEIL